VSQVAEEVDTAEEHVSDALRRLVEERAVFL
jgi:hypothetical protein